MSLSSAVHKATVIAATLAKCNEQDLCDYGEWLEHNGVVDCHTCTWFCSQVRFGPWAMVPSGETPNVGLSVDCEYYKRHGYDFIYQQVSVTMLCAVSTAVLHACAYYRLCQVQASLDEMDNPIQR